MTSVSLLPLSLHMIIYQTSPFWTSILAFWLNGERIQMFEYFAMALCFLGVVAIALSKQSSVALETNEEFIGVGVCFCVAWAYASCNVISRKLKDVHFSVICFYHPIIGATTAAAVLLCQGVFAKSSLVMHDLSLYGWLLLACACDFIVFNSQNIAF